jgi:hypothetical protein
MNKGFRYIIYSLFAITMVACSGTKYVPEGAFLLDKVAVQADNNDTKSTDLSIYIRQKPNNRWFECNKNAVVYLQPFRKRLYQMVQSDVKKDW